MDMTDAMVYWDDVSDPSNPGWLLRTKGKDEVGYPGVGEDIALDTEGEDHPGLATTEAARHLGWDKWEVVAKVESSGDTIYHLYPDPRCKSCAETGYITPAIGNTRHPDYSDYQLCRKCIDNYNAEWDEAAGSVAKSSFGLIKKELGDAFRLLDRVSKELGKARIDTITRADTHLHYAIHQTKIAIDGGFETGEEEGAWRTILDLLEMTRAATGNLQALATRGAVSSGGIFSVKAQVGLAHRVVVRVSRRIEGGQ